MEEAVQGEGAVGEERGVSSMHSELTRLFRKLPQLLMQADGRSTQPGNDQVIGKLLQHLHAGAHALRRR